MVLAPTALRWSAAGRLPLVGIGPSAATGRNLSDPSLHSHPFLPVRCRADPRHRPGDDARGRCRGRGRSPPGHPQPRRRQPDAERRGLHRRRRSPRRRCRVAPGCRQPAPHGVLVQTPHGAAVAGSGRHPPTLPRRPRLHADGDRDRRPFLHAAGGCGAGAAQTEANGGDTPGPPRQQGGGDGAGVFQRRPAPGDTRSR